MIPLLEKVKVSDHDHDPIPPVLSYEQIIKNAYWEKERTYALSVNKRLFAASVFVNDKGGFGRDKD